MPNTAPQPNGIRTDKIEGYENNALIMYHVGGFGLNPITTVQRDALTDVLINTSINNSDTSQLERWDGSNWVKINQEYDTLQTVVDRDGLVINDIGIELLNVAETESIFLSPGANGLGVQNISGKRTVFAPGEVNFTQSNTKSVRVASDLVNSLYTAQFPDKTGTQTIAMLSDITGGGGAVESVNTKTGAVTLNQDEIPDGTTYKQYSATEKTKLAGIAPNATANQSDATTNAAIALKENTANKQNSLTSDGTGAKFPTVDATNTALALKANIASPTFTGAPLAPTAADNTNTAQIATTQFVQTAANAKVENNLTTSTTVAPSKTAVQSALDLKAPLASPALTGTPTAPTATAGTNTNQIATTANVVATANAKVAETITNGVQGVAPSQDAVYDELQMYSKSITKSTSAGTMTSGTTEQIVQVITIPAGASKADNFLSVFVPLTKTGNAAAATVRMRLSTTPTGGTQIATFTMAATTGLQVQFTRTFMVQAGNLLNGFPAAQNAGGDEGVISLNARFSEPFDPTVVNYIIVTAQPGSTDTVNSVGYLVTRK